MAGERRPHTAVPAEHATTTRQHGRAGRYGSSIAAEGASSGHCSIAQAAAAAAHAGARFPLLRSAALPSARYLSLRRISLYRTAYLSACGPSCWEGTFTTAYLPAAVKGAEGVAWGGMRALRRTSHGARLLSAPLLQGSRIYLVRSLAGRRGKRRRVHRLPSWEPRYGIALAVSLAVASLLLPAGGALRLERYFRRTCYIRLSRIVRQRGSW